MVSLRRRSLLSVLLLVGLLAGAATAPAAHAIRLGVQDDSVLLEHRYYDAATALQQARDMGARVVRFNVISTQLAATGFKPYDEAIANARRAGMQVHLTLMGAPRYIRHGDRRLSYWNPSPTRFATFAGNIARRYRSKVTSYGIWNEPNLGQFLGPAKRAPQIYGRLFVAGQKAIRRADSRALVLIGETTSTRKLDAIRFLERTAKSVKGGLRADGFAHHPFQFDVAPNRVSSRFLGIGATREIQQRLRKMAGKKLLRTRAGGTLPVYYTEFSYNRHGSIYPTSESRRASWSRLAVSVARRYDVRLLLFYQLVEQPHWALKRPGTWNSSIIALNGKPYSAYTAIQRAWRGY